MVDDDDDDEEEEEEEEQEQEQEGQAWNSVEKHHMEKKMVDGE